MAFWVFSPFQVPAPALVHIIIFHHFITKLPLKLSKGYFKPCKAGESECTSPSEADGKQMVELVKSVKP